MTSLFAWLRQKYSRSKEQIFSDLPDVHWVGEADSPLGRAVLDCRGYCRLMAMTPPGAAIAERFALTKRSDIAQVEGKLPEGATAEGLSVCWRYSAAEMALLRSGFRPEVLEDLWLIRHAGSRLYVQRSWTGVLMYVAELAELQDDGDGGAITRLWLHGSNARSHDQRVLAAALCRYLLDSHVLRRPAAVPVPGDLAGDMQRMARFAFSVAGRHGDYAEPFWPEIAGPALGLT